MIILDFDSKDFGSRPVLMAEWLWLQLQRETCPACGKGFERADVATCLTGENLKTVHAACWPVYSQTLSEKPAPDTGAE